MVRRPPGQPRECHCRRPPPTTVAAAAACRGRCSSSPSSRHCLPSLRANSPAETKKLLYALFGQFGKVIDVVVMRREGLRGQAWVVFGDLGASSAALRAMDGFPFWDRPMVSDKREHFYRFVGSGLHLMRRC